MAGSGVGVGGTSMLRTRRRDVSIKPNRRLDRKSSRGMIYENEELRLRTININAEVEQGQNDIKKLRRENEQLRREIWSLRDEYDKLEELVKNQSSQGSSDEIEGRTGEEDNADDAYTECSGDEEVVEEEEEDEEIEGDEEDGISEDGKSKEEDLENAENQKISSEKMNSNSSHRLHVEFDDLSIVDEEEELKKDKEKNSVALADDPNLQASRGAPELQENPRITSDPDENFPSYFSPSTFDLGTTTTNLTAAERNYFNDSPFVFPNPLDPNYPKMLPIDAHNFYSGPITPLPDLDTPSMGHVDPIFGTAKVPNLPQRRNITFKPPANFLNDIFPYRTQNANGTPNSGDVVTQNGWDFGGTTNGGNSTSSPRPKHFFAPLPYRVVRGQKSDTATSSGSDKTSSTVISRNRVKGTADVYVNGGYPVCDDNSDDNQAAFLSSDNLVVEEARNVSRGSSNNPLVKSLSCQDLSTDPQSLSFGEKLKIFNNDEKVQRLITKSDNTLDSISTNATGRPFKSQLNVTLKLPRAQVPASPDTPEIPKLPKINYRLFNNPFLQNYQSQEAANYRNFNVESPGIRPLSVQVENAALNNNFNFKTRAENDPRLLLMAANQFRNLEESSSALRPNIGFEVTSFEGPSPQTLLSKGNPMLQNRRLYQNVPNGHVLFPTNLQAVIPSRVPAQTQTSIDGDSQPEENPRKLSAPKDSQGPVPGGSPLTLRRKRTLRKERSGSIKDKRPLSPAAQRRKDRLRKQNSTTSTEAPESPVKTPVKGRKFSLTSTSTTAEVQEKNESRSSSSGQDSPKKEQRRRVSLYFNSKKRPSLVSTKVERRGSSVDGRFPGRNDHQDGTTTNSERERTNSVSSRDTVIKGRKLSTGSGKVPWCACWGNGCI